MEKSANLRPQFDVQRLADECNVTETEARGALVLVGGYEGAVAYLRERRDRKRSNAKERK